MLRYSMALISILALAGAAVASDDKKDADQDKATEFVHGAPSDASQAWTLAAGGRIYDNWWEALERKKPEGTHRLYPADGPVKGPNTFRCKECHGWDYRGRDGDYAKGSHATGIKGIRGASGDSVDEIVKLLRAPAHGYTPEMINDDELKRVALFVSKGQHDMTKLINRNGKVKGDAKRGAGIYQTTCAACHGFDGKQLDWGKPGEPEYIGTAANMFPAEVLHKIRNSQPGAVMINLRAFPLQDAVDVLAYAQTLPVK